MAKSNAGRKTVMTPDVLYKLEEAFKLGCSDEESCLNANIGMSTLYKYQVENPKFMERKRLLKETPVFRARKTVVREIEKDPALALKYLERKKKKEFSMKVEVENTNINLNEILAGADDELAEAIKESLKKKLIEGEKQNSKG